MEGWVHGFALLSPRLARLKPLKAPSLTVPGFLMVSVTLIVRIMTA